MPSSFSQIAHLEEDPSEKEGGRQPAVLLADRWPFRVRHSDWGEAARAPDRTPWQSSPRGRRIVQPEPRYPLSWRTPSVDRRKPG